MIASIFSFVPRVFPPNLTETSNSGEIATNIVDMPLITEFITSTFPPQSAAENSVPIPVSTDLGIDAFPLRCVHASAGGWAPDNRETAIIQLSRIEGVVIAAYEPNQAEIAIQRFRDAGVKAFIIRAAAHTPPSADPTVFIDETLPRLKEYYNALGDNSMIVMIGNAPNARVEGWSEAWQNGGEFADWFLQVAQTYRNVLPGVQIGFPPMSPGGDLPGIREDEWRFLAEAAGAVNEADWFAVAAYWVVDGSDVDMKPQLWRRVAQDKPIIGVEVGELTMFQLILLASAMLIKDLLMKELHLACGYYQAQAHGVRQLG